MKNLVELPVLFLIFLRNSSKQKKFLKQTISDAIIKSKNKNDESLDNDDYKKIQLYGYAVPAMLGEAYCVLRNQKMTTNERLSITFLGSITGLFDDMFDKKVLTEEYIKNMIVKPSFLVGNNSNEKLFLTLYNNALEITQNKAVLIKKALAVFEAQILSRKQKQPEIDLSEIEEITFQKGGSSMLMYRSTLNNKIDDPEKLMIYLLGGIGQLENDIFDIYKDYKEGIKTLATTMQKTSHLREKYLALMADVFDSVEKTNFPTGAKKKFRRIISLVMSRGLVCLDCIEKNEKTTQNQFHLEKYERKDLICDMESLGSFLKLIHYSAKYNF
ncbi:MAG: hypothetical protein PHS59_12460 [Paludibacter sp.]|nr:hypothetical protein [Paludibacter sp.]